MNSEMTILIQFVLKNYIDFFLISWCIKVPLCSFIYEDKSFSNNIEKIEGVIKIWKISVFLIDADVGCIIQKIKIALLLDTTFENWNHPHRSLSTLSWLYYYTVLSILLLSQEGKSCE